MRAHPSISSVAGLQEPSNMSCYKQVVGAGNLYHIPQETITAYFGCEIRANQKGGLYEGAFVDRRNQVILPHCLIK
jgi:hypothetical protein